MRILILADFKRDDPRALVNNSRRLAKGFLRAGHDVLEFSYREQLLAASPVRSKKWAKRLAKKTTDRLLAENARHFLPDLVLLTAFKLLDADTLDQLRHAAPHAPIFFWYGDSWVGSHARLAPIARHCDCFLATSAGHALQDWANLTNAPAAFLPNPCDPDLDQPVPRPSSPRSSSPTAVFIGKLTHSLPHQDPNRSLIIETLVAENRLSVHGCLGRPPLLGRQYLDAIAAADLALSINAYNDVPRYHSDRLIHCVASGTFTLAAYVPESELLFEDPRHLRYFHDLDQCRDLLDHYLAHPDERQTIAAAGRQHALDEFNPQRLALCITDLYETGRFNAPWAQFVPAPQSASKPQEIAP